MFVTYQPARVISADAVAILAKETKTLGDEGLSSRISFPDGIVVSGVSQNDHTKGYVTRDGEIIEFSGEVCVYNPSAEEKLVYTVLSDTF